MTGPTHDRRGKRRREWGGRGVKRMGRFEPALKTETHLGIERQPRDRTAADLPITPPQAEVLAILSQEPQGVTAIARQCGRTTSSVASSCYALADRGLVVRQGRGWRLPDA